FSRTEEAFRQLQGIGHGTLFFNIDANFPPPSYPQQRTRPRMRKIEAEQGFSGQLRLSRWSIAECHLVRADSQITAKNIAQKPVGGNEAFAIPLEVESRRPLMLLGRQSLPNAIEQAGFHVQPSPPNMDFPFLEWHRIWRFSPNSRSFQILRK